MSHGRFILNEKEIRELYLFATKNATHLDRQTYYEIEFADNGAGHSVFVQVKDRPHTLTPITDESKFSQR